MVCSLKSWLLWFVECIARKNYCYKIYISLWSSAEKYIFKNNDMIFCLQNVQFLIFYIDWHHFIVLKQQRLKSCLSDLAPNKKCILAVSSPKDCRIFVTGRLFGLACWNRKIILYFKVFTQDVYQLFNRCFFYWNFIKCLFNIEYCNDLSIRSL